MKSKGKRKNDKKGKGKGKEKHIRNNRTRPRLIPFPLQKSQTHARFSPSFAGQTGGKLARAWSPQCRPHPRSRYLPVSAHRGGGAGGHLSPVGHSPGGARGLPAPGSSNPSCGAEMKQMSKTSHADGNSNRQMLRMEGGNPDPGARGCSGPDSSHLPHPRICCSGGDEQLGSGEWKTDENREKKGDKKPSRKVTARVTSS